MKSKKSKRKDFTPVTGGVDRSKYLRDDVIDAGDLSTDSDVDLHIVRLLSLHPDLSIQFRSQDLSQLDGDTKLALLADINDVLGIRQLAK